MSKAIRKPRPSVPKYYWWDTDNCWGCRNRLGCNGCKILKAYVAVQRAKEDRKQVAWLRNLNIKQYLQDESIE